jgi:hypothetical protein
MSALGDLLLEVHASLDRARIPHAIGGAIALGYCTLEPRGTRDLDVNVFVGPERAKDVLTAMPPVVEIDGSRLEALERDGQTRLRAGDTPVDVFLSVLPFHEEVRAHVRLVPFEGQTIPVLGCTGLAVFKAMFARSQDWVDIERMVEARSLDLPEAIRWVGEMAGTESDQLARLTALGARRPPS